MEPRDYEIQALGENRISIDELHVLSLALHKREPSPLSAGISLFAVSVGISDPSMCVNEA